MQTQLSGFPERLLQAIQRAGISQTTLAKTLGVSKNTVTSWVRGESLPSLDRAAALAAALEVSLDDLVAEPVAPRGDRLITRLANPEFVAGITLLAKEMSRFAAVEAASEPGSGRAS